MFILDCIAYITFLCAQCPVKYIICACFIAFQIDLLDMKASMNVNIFLKQFKAKNEEIVQLIKSGDESKIGAEKLKGLLKILPESDQVIQHFKAQIE